ncbi:rRNA maturation RNase YbeY [Bacteroidia bacterium]|nr:rRNA maturation RNase YbeY [Bacteroidia bacterium]MDB4106949.1 rRNA maturation RNase YbeY [Bacteroidia bacterium]MDB9882089.1 rRNA maturation RNase YbeY [Bacteroidia bacterium]
MFSNNITIETDLQSVEGLIDLVSLEQTFSKLQLSKPTIVYLITDDELLEVNKQSLNHDYYTDIITFDYSKDEDITHHEILISWDRVKENANDLKQPLYRELNRVCIHGLLHLAGYNDETDDEKQKMRSLEDHYLDLYCST